MSIWSTFKTIKVHDSGCDDDKVYLSSAWYGFPLRLSIRSGDMHADAALTRDQAGELGRELLEWADRDLLGDIRMSREYRKLPGFTMDHEVREVDKGGYTLPEATGITMFTCSCGDTHRGARVETEKHALEHVLTVHPKWESR